MSKPAANKPIFDNGIRGKISEWMCPRCGCPIKTKSGGDHSFSICMDNLKRKLSLADSKKDLLEHQIAFDYSPTLRNIWTLLWKWIKIKLGGEDEEA